MTVYILNYLSLPFYSLLIKNKKIQIIIVGFQMFLILAFRSIELGSDLGNYQKYYNYWSSYTLIEMIRNTGVLKFKGDWGLESGYVWLNWFAAKIGLDFHALLIIISFICIWSLCHFLNKYAENGMLAMAIVISFGLYSSFFYILRQSLAMAVLLYSVDSVKNRNLFRFLSLVFIAFLLHRASIVFVIIYLAYKIHITKMTFLLFYITCALELFLIPILYNKLFLPLLFIIGKEDIYSEIFFQSNNMVICMIVLSVILLILTKAGLFFRDDSNELYRIFFWTLMSAILVEIVSLYSPVISRIAICMLFPFSSVLLADIFTKQRMYMNRHILVTSSYMILFVFYVYQLFSSSIVPYRIWK